MPQSTQRDNNNTKSVIIIGGGTSGLCAAYTLKKHGIRAILLEAGDRVGGRLGGDRVDGFLLDEGADFFTASHDVALRLCEELGLPLVRSMMKLGWYKSGRFFTTTPEQTLAGVISDLPALWNLGLISPRAIRASMKMSRTIKNRPEHLSFASNSMVAEIDEEESANDYMKRIGVPEDVRLALRGLLEMTMGELDEMSAAFALTFIAQIMMKTDELYVPEEGIGSLTHALADACGADIRVSSPVKRVVIQNGGRNVPPDTLEGAARLAAYHSGLRGENRARVMVAERRHVRKPARARPGQVTIRKGKARTVVVDAVEPNWQEAGGSGFSAPE